METLNTYQIDLRNLSLATAYKFNYVLGNDFFECLDGSEIRQGKVDVSLSVVRVSAAFELNFHSEGVVTVTCDRCLDDMEVPIKTDNRLIVTFGDTYSEVSDEKIVIPEDEGTINVAWYMYEFIALAIPMKHIHEPEECNEVMASKLSELCVDEIEEDCVDDDSLQEKGKKSVDPRWEALRNLMGDN